MYIYREKSELSKHVLKTCLFVVGRVLKYTTTTHRFVLIISGKQQPIL